jgi:AraC-like DNA-binding protein
MKPYLCGLKIKKPGYSFSNKKHANLQLNLIMKGSLEVSINGESSHTKPGMLFFISPGNSVELKSPKGYTGVFAVFRPSEEFKWVKGGIFTASPDLYRIAQMIYSEILSPPKSEIETLPVMFELFCSLAFRFREAQRKTGKNYGPEFWAKQVKRQVDAHIYTPAKIEEIVESIPLCKRQLFKHFRKHYGCSIKKYQMKRKIEEAEKLLSQPGMKATDAAYELGFSSSQHFSTAFKKFTGRSPGAFSGKT